MGDLAMPADDAWAAFAGDELPSTGTPSDAASETGNLVRFAVGTCSLGMILVATTTGRVRAILFGDDPERLTRDLRERFPEARLIGAEDELEQLVGKVVGFVEAPAAGLDLPLDLRGTAFQLRVWQALREIPAGLTASYSDIAERIGAPKEAYAVGEACAANMIAVAIPCHRVVRKDGGLAGYRWGLWRKRALLRREGAR
jgi:AraC family transcriptional regulator, regulatory protein of adaptative response / methylated-DNA-[protein]-cysteine methyltransferase